MYKEQQDKSDTTRSRRLEARVTESESELSEVVRLAQQCGLTQSGYLRRCALG